MTIAKILLPHDGTEMSDRAVDKAKEFAKAFDAELLILHVIEHVPIPPSLILGNERVWINRTRRSISRKLEEAWMKMVQEKLINGLTKENIKATPRVLVGNTINSISDQILKFAKDNQVDLIIMGSERLEKRISKVKALGSVSRGVSERASCPVVLIHQ
ncbi:MAG: universal stress protein [Ignavibacteriales bacterium]